MSYYPPPDPAKKAPRIHLEIDGTHPALLTGLDTLLRLGLISSVKVTSLCEKQLSCPLPEIQTQRETSPATSPFSAEMESQPQVNKHPPHSVVHQIWQAFKDELSVRWLLFLGLFLVVVSSGVLAASQWERFPAIAQYGVLWLYTMVFWFGGVWASRQPGLRLTAQTLQTIALLLIPVNCWAMTILIGSLGGMIVMAIAALTLVPIYRGQTQGLLRGQQGSITTINFWLLSLAHWTWNWGGGSVPVLSLYGGTLLTAGLMKPWSRVTSSSRSSQPLLGLLFYALAVLFVRAVFIDGLAIEKLGLAIGLYGWLFQGILPARQRIHISLPAAESEPDTKLDSAAPKSDVAQQTESSPVQSSPSRTTQQLSLPVFGHQVLEATGLILLLFAWLITFQESFPWQAVVISLLTLQFLFARLTRDWQHKDLLGLFIVGYSLNFLLWSLLPDSIQSAISSTLTDWANDASTPWAIYGVSLWLFLGVFLRFTDWLHRRSQPKLARFGTWLIFLSAVTLGILAVVNPLWRSLNLVCAAVALSYCAYRRSEHRRLRIFAAHGLGLGAMISSFTLVRPPLIDWQWGAVLMGLAVVQWVGSARWARARRNVWRWLEQSCWHYGIGLALLSYGGFWFSLQRSLQTPVSDYPVSLWGLVPVALTIVAFSFREQRRQQAAFVSCLGLFLLQGLTLWEPGVRLVGLGAAALLMIANTYLLVHPITAMMQIGFSLGCLMVFLWEKIALADGLLVGAIVLLGLWTLRVGLSSAGQRQRSDSQLSAPPFPPLITAYRIALARWSTIVTIVLLWILSFHTIYVVLGEIKPVWQVVVTALLVGSAVLWRVWKKSSNRAILALLILAEILLAELVIYSGGNHLTLATANVGFALGTWGGTQWFFTQRSPWSRLEAVGLAPVWFAFLSVICRLGTLTAWSGLWTLGAAIACLGAASRRQNWKGLSYFALVGVTLGLYELVFYPMVYVAEFLLADELILLSLITAVIAVGYRLFAWRWHKRGYHQFLGLTIAEIVTAAHLHWAIGSLIKPFAAITGFGKITNFTTLSLTISLFLAAYALVQGRDDDPETTATKAYRLTDGWIYIGIAEVAGTFVYARFIWSQLKVLDPFLGLIVCLLALVIYQLPWRNLGWRRNVWRRIALVIPALCVLVTYESVSYLSLFLVVLFYGQMAIREKNIRWAYVGLGFFDWAIARGFYQLNWADNLFYICLFGGSLLFIAQVDPSLRQSAMRQRRHYLRLFASSLMGTVAVFTHQTTGLIPATMGLVGIFAGLGLRVRAFLFVGTLTFLATAFYQLVIAALEYPLAKWLIGLAVGVLLIAIAANFERRREQILTVLQNWFAQLQQWE